MARDHEGSHWYSVADINLDSTLKRYRVSYIQTEVRQCQVNAENESAARQTFLDGGEEFDRSVEVIDTEVTEVVEL